jgi:dTDP-4-amino-4,6-dideoxygalactose transaminase
VIPLFQVAMEPDAIRRATDVLVSGYIGQGAQVEAFESAFGALVGSKEPPLSTNSCTSALMLALKLIGVGPGDEVVTTPMTCAATNAAIVSTGATIRWADIDPVTGLIDPEDVKFRLRPNTRCIVAVDWGGRVCDYEALKQFGLPVVEDAAHALLSTQNGRGLPAIGGDYVCWSFQAIKHLTTIDGGALLPPSDQLERGRLLRWYGLNRRSKESFRAGQNIREVGNKWHMHDVSAAVGLGNLGGARARVERCRANADFYDAALAGLCGLPPADAGAAWWLYTVLVDHRNEWVGALKAAGVEAGVAHSRNDRNEGFQKSAARDPRPLPGVDAFDSRQLCIPVGWWVTDEARAEVVAAMAQCAERVCA